MDYKNSYSTELWTDRLENYDSVICFIDNTMDELTGERDELTIVGANPIYSTGTS